MQKTFWAGTCLSFRWVNGGETLIKWPINRYIQILWGICVLAFVSLLLGSYLQRKTSRHHLLAQSQKEAPRIVAELYGSHAPVVVEPRLFTYNFITHKVNLSLRLRWKHNPHQAFWVDGNLHFKEDQLIWEEKAISQNLTRFISQTNLVRQNTLAL